MTTTPAAVEALKLAEEAKVWIAQVAIAGHRHSPAQIKVAVEAMEAFIDRLAALAHQSPPTGVSGVAPLTEKKIERLWAKSVRGLRADVIGFARAIEAEFGIGAAGEGAEQ